MDRLKILIAEDDESSYLYLSAALKEMASTILHATTGTESIELSRSNPDIDLILMDIKMPLTDGYEATRQIREFNKEVVIIAQTAYALAGDKEKAFAAGCTCYVAKPVGKDNLTELIRTHFSDRS